MFAERVYTLGSADNILGTWLVRPNPTDYTAAANTPRTASFTISNQTFAFRLRATGASATVWGSRPSGVGHFGDNDTMPAVVERGWAEEEGPR